MSITDLAPSPDRARRRARYREHLRDRRRRMGVLAEHWLRLARRERDSAPPTKESEHTEESPRHKERRGVPLSRPKREANYLTQTGRLDLTPRQGRRARRKANRQQGRSS